MIDNIKDPALKVLVTGAAGYLGSKLCTVLLNKGHTVVGIDCMRYGADNAHAIHHIINHPRFTFHNRKVTASILTEPYDFIFHFAGLVGFPLCERDPDLAAEAHVTATTLLVSHLRKTGGHLVYPNTNSGYGTTDPGNVCHELTMMNPVSIYGRTKLEGELIACQAPKYTVFRLATVFGDSYRIRRDLLVNSYTWDAYKNGVIKVYQPDVMRNYVHIDTVISVFIDTLTNPALENSIFNLGCDELNCSKMDMALKIASVHDQLYPKKKVTIITDNSWSDPDKRNYRVSSKKLQAILNYISDSSVFDQQIMSLYRTYSLFDLPSYGNY